MQSEWVSLQAEFLVGRLCMYEEMIAQHKRFVSQIVCTMLMWSATRMKPTHGSLIYLPWSYYR